MRARRSAPARACPSPTAGVAPLAPLRRRGEGTRSTATLGLNATLSLLVLWRSPARADFWLRGDGLPSASGVLAPGEPPPAGTTGLCSAAQQARNAHVRLAAARRPALYLICDRLGRVTPPAPRGRKARPPRPAEEVPCAITHRSQNQAPARAARPVDARVPDRVRAEALARPALRAARRAVSAPGAHRSLHRRLRRASRETCG